jgi:hypothetical protein
MKKSATNYSIEEKDLPDGALLCSFVIPSSPATKKNSNRIIKIKGFMKIIPSERFMKYQKFCGDFLLPIRKNKDLLAYNFGVSVKIRVATDKWIIPDYTNICQALGDILQHYDVISDDKWIHWTDGGVVDNIPIEHWFIGVDKTNPRLEVEIRRFRHPIEDKKP